MQSNAKRPDASLRPAIRLGAGLTVIACLLLLVAALRSVRAPAPESGLASNSELPQAAGLANSRRPTTSPNAGTPGILSGPSAAAQATQPPERVQEPEPTEDARRLVASLVHLEILGGVLTEEQAAVWKQNLQELITQGAVGVAAIREFLAQNKEYYFGGDAKDKVGYASARTALLDALVQIGGPGAVNAMAAVLQTSADPREIALLAQDLEKLDPGQHRQEVLDAARQTLEMVSSRKLEMPDAAPLFEVLQRFGGPAVVADLERATSQWNYYGTIALAQLPDDAGIPVLVQLAQDPKTSGGVRDAALQMLAQVSDRSAEARATLLTLGKMNQLSLFTWQMVAAALAGDQVGLQNSVFEDHQGLAQISGLRTVATSDNQNFFALPGTLTPEQVNQHIALIDDLLSSTSDTNAKEVLQQSRTLLKNRVSLATAFGQ